MQRKQGEEMRLEYDRQQIIDVMDRIVRKTETMDLTWDWPCGVAYYGLCEAYHATGDQKIIDFLKNWVDEYIALGLPSWNVNTCAMGHCLITLYEETGDKKYWEILMEKIDYLENDALRFGDHVLQHTVSSNNDFPEQCWADTLFMAAFLLLRVGSKLKYLNPDDPKDQAIAGDAGRAEYIALLGRALDRVLVSRLQQYPQEPHVRFFLGPCERVGGLHDVAGAAGPEGMVSLSKVYGCAVLPAGSAGSAQAGADGKRSVAHDR